MVDRKDRYNNMDNKNIVNIIMDKFNDYLEEEADWDRLLSKIKDKEVYDEVEGKIIENRWKELEKDIRSILYGQN